MRVFALLVVLLFASAHASPSLAIAFNPHPCSGSGLFSCLPAKPKPRASKPKPKPKPGLVESDDAQVFIE